MTLDADLYQRCRLAWAESVYTHGGFLIAQREGREYHIDTETGDWTRVGLLGPVVVTVH